MPGRIMRGRVCLSSFFVFTARSVPITQETSPDEERSRRFIRWTLVHGWREVPAAPRRVPHFHINLLPAARKVSTTRALMSAYLSYLYRCGEKRVYGQIVTFESRRGEKMFERYGFKVLNRAEITKYKAFYPESVYLSTVIKNLETAEPLSAYSRVRE